MVDWWYSGAYSKTQGWFTSSCVLTMIMSVLNDISATSYIHLQLLNVKEIDGIHLKFEVYDE